MGTLRGFGSRQVGLQLLQSLERLDKSASCTFWLPESWSRTDYETLTARDIHTVPGGLRSKFILENLVLRDWLYRHPDAALFSMGDTSLPFCPNPHILLVQQAYLTLHLDAMDFALPPSMHLRFQAMQAYFQLGLPSVNAIVVQTLSMHQRIVQRWPSLSPERVHIIPTPPRVDLPSLPLPGTNTRPYLCYVASFGPHKNFDVLPQIMASLPPHLADLDLHLTVQPEQVPHLVEAAHALKCIDRIHFRGSMSRPEVLALLRDAQALVMPSWLESFGLPFYEAMVLQTPIIASDLDFAREACGPAALYAPPNQPELWAHAIATCLDHPEDTAKRVAVGMQRVQHTAHAELAVSYLELLETL